MFVPSSPFSLLMLTVQQQQQQQWRRLLSIVMFSSNPHPSPHPCSFVTTHLCTQQEEEGGGGDTPATVGPARPHTGPYIDELQLFPNPALDFDPLPFIYVFLFPPHPHSSFEPSVPEDTSDLVVVSNLSLLM